MACRAARGLAAGSTAHACLPDCLPAASQADARLAFGNTSLSPNQSSEAKQTLARPCRGGISHSPQEHVAPDDVAAATAALHRYLRREALLPKS